MLDIPAGATVAQYIQKKWGRAVRTVPLQTVAVLTSATQLVKNNPRRFVVEMFNVGTGNVYVLNDPTVTTANGILLSPLGGSIILSAEEDGELVCYPWYAISGATGNNVGVLETESI
jgi:hypothetical protein